MSTDRGAKKHSPFTFIDHSVAAGGSPSQRRSLIQRHIAVQTRNQKRKQTGQRDPARAESGLLYGPDKPQSDPERSNLSECTSDSDTPQTPSTALQRRYTANQRPMGARNRSLQSMQISTNNPRELELMNYLTHVIWPGFSSLDACGVANPFAHRWLPRAFQNPALRHALLMAASYHLEVRYPALSKNNDTLAEQLFYENESIRHLRTQLQNLSQSDKDDVFMIILCHVTNQRRQRQANTVDPTPFTPPLRSGNWINIYGTWEFSEMHWRNLVNLVSSLGGIACMKEYGLPWLFTYTDLLQSVALARKPAFPLYSPGGRRVQPEKMENILDEPIISDLQRQPGRGFSYLEALGCESDHVRAFSDLSIYSNCLDAFQKGELHDITVARLCDSRNEITHRVFSLPSLEELERIEDLYLEGDDFDDHVAKRDRGSMRLYEACRLTAMLYSLMVTFPLPRSHHARNILLNAIKESLLSIDLSHRDVDFYKAYLWCTVVAGASSETDAWLEERAALASIILENGSWEEVEDILESFVWLASACSVAGFNFWIRVINRAQIVLASEQ